MNRIKTVLIPSLLAATAIPAVSSFAVADTVLEEVVVTARKRAESLQDVPQAVSAFTSEQLQNSMVQDITDLERLSPNVTLTETSGLVGGAVSIFMRGIGNDPGFDQGIGIYVDDVYLNRTTGALLKVFDVDRIELLKGPQGNLYGRNTIGGAVKYVSKEPGEEVDGSVAVAAGSFGRKQLKASVSGPINDDGLGGSASVYYAKRNGIQTNTADGKDYWDEDVKAFSGKLVWQISEGHRLKLHADYMKDSATPRLPNRIATDNATLGGIDFVITGANTYLGGTGLFASPTDKSLPGDEDSVSTEFGAGFDQYEIETSTLAATYIWDVDDHWTVKSVTAARSVENTQAFDFDGSEQQFITTLQPRESDDYSQEFQANYAKDDLNVVLGLYYLDASQDNLNQTEQYPRLRAIQTHSKNTTVDNRELESVSAYASVDWDFRPDWQLSVGGRYTRDSKTLMQRATVDQTFFALANITGFPAAAVVAVAPGMEAAAEVHPAFAGWATPFTRALSTSTAENVDAKDDWAEFTPSIKLSHNVDEDTLVYAGVSTGFKSGGFQTTGGVATPYEPETVTSYTVGAKTTSEDGKLRVNAEIFLNDYKDKQLATIVLSGGSLTQTVDNVGELTTRGVEIEAMWLPSANWMVAANIGYLHSKVDAFASFAGGLPVDLGDTTDVGFAPEWTAQLRSQYELDLDGVGVVTLGGDVSYRTESFTNSPIDTTDSLATQQMQESHYLVNAALAWRSVDGLWRLALEGKNLQNKRVLTNSFVVGPFVTGGYNLPRTWLLSAERSY